MCRLIKFPIPFLIVLMISTLTVSTGAMAQDPPTQDPPKPQPAKASADKTPAEKAQAAAEKTKARRQDLISKTWWNQPKKIEELGLKQEQRSKMDAAIQAFLKNRQNSPREQHKALNAFGEALAKGDQETARRHGDSVAQAISDPVRGQIDMMIEVVALLTPEQRQKLASTYPKLLTRLWIRSANPRGMVSGGRRGSPPK